MNYRDIGKILSFFLYGLSATLLVPFFLALYYEHIADPLLHPQPHSSGSFLISLLISLAAAIACQLISRKASGHLYRKEGLAIVVIIWFLTPAFAALPFWFSGTLTNPWAAYFEAVSGLTTTGATVIEAKKYEKGSQQEIPIVKTIPGVINSTYSFYGTIEPIRDPKTGLILHEGVEAVSRALLFWRSFIQWLGGGGIAILFVAVLPILGAGGKMLLQTEVTGPIKDTLRPRIKETAIQIWLFYLILTFVQIFLLKSTNSRFEWFDAITVTFSTISTGGFSIRNSNIAYYQSALSESIIMAFMFLGSINFSLYYYILRGKFYRLFEKEFILYLAILFFSCAISVWNLLGVATQNLDQNPTQLMHWSEAIRYGTFQTISSISTTGFVTANYDKWPYVVQTLMLIVMFVGGMSGSTAGGIKIIRHYILFRLAQFRVESLFRPHNVRKFKLGNSEVDQTVTTSVLCFFFLIISLSVAGTFLYIMDGIDPQTALGLVGCMINGSGLAFRVANPVDSCAFMSNFSFFLSSILMILGRLEFVAVLALLVPAFWKSE
jgi:trk system potassium uptake protein